MNFPIPVNMTVSESVQQYGFSASETDIPVDFEVATPVVASNIPDYEGPYSVTPSESVHTLETDGKAMTDDVTVNPAPPAVLESYHAFTIAPYGTPDENGVINIHVSNTRGYFPVEQSGWVTHSNCFVWHLASIAVPIR